MEITVSYEQELQFQAKRRKATESFGPNPCVVCGDECECGPNCNCGPECTCCSSYVKSYTENKLMTFKKFIG